MLGIATFLHAKTVADTEENASANTAETSEVDNAGKFKTVAKNPRTWYAADHQLPSVIKLKGFCCKGEPMVLL